MQVTKDKLMEAGFRPELGTVLQWTKLRNVYFRKHFSATLSNVQMVQIRLLLTAPASKACTRKLHRNIKVDFRQRLQS